MTWTAPLLNRGGPRRRLVVFPHAGAGPSGYRPLTQTGLPRDTDILGVTLPGREHRMDEPPATDLREVVHAVALELHDLEPIPTVLVGHSFGAQLAAALAHACPNLCAAAVLSSHPPPADFLTLTDDDTLDLAALLTATNTPTDLLDDPELHDWLRRLLDADLNLDRQAAHHLRDAELQIPIVVLGGAQDPIVNPNTLTGWQRHARAGMRTLILPGGHHYLHHEPATTQVRDELRALLDAATRERSDSPLTDVNANLRRASP